MRIDFQNSDIKFFFSFQCPYSYIAWEILKTIIKEKKVSVTPMEIGLFPPGKSYLNFQDLWCNERWDRLIKDAKKVDIEIAPLIKSVSATNAVRAIKSFELIDTKNYITSIFRAVFSRQLNISEPNSLRLYLQSEGIDSSILAKALDNPDTEKEAIYQTSLWEHERIRMTPTIEFKSERYCGLTDKFGLERFLLSAID